MPQIKKKTKSTRKMKKCASFPLETRRNNPKNPKSIKQSKETLNVNSLALWR